MRAGPPGVGVRRVPGCSRGAGPVTMRGAWADAAREKARPAGEREEERRRSGGGEEERRGGEDKYEVEEEKEEGEVEEEEDEKVRK
ncbi:hypothetical protein CRUP_017120, partial [Coryphaenoides rupestris]